jgi:tetratricopeptide (TPR) repeat protein
MRGAESKATPRGSTKKVEAAGRPLLKPGPILADTGVGITMKGFAPHIAGRILPFVLMQIAGFSGTASAQTPDAQPCFSHDPDVAIAGCTAMLQSGHETQEHIARGFSNRGGAYIRKRQYDLAIQDLDQAIQRDPNYAATFRERGLAYAGKRQYNRAIQDYDRAIRLYPKLDQAFYDRAAALRSLQQQAPSEADFAKAGPLNPNLPPPTDGLGDGGAKSPALPIPREVTADDLRKVTAGMNREQLLQLGSPAARITMDDDGHLIEIYQYSANGSGIGTVRLTDGTVSSVQRH